jgi:hypothetical protein
MEVTIFKNLTRETEVEFYQVVNAIRLGKFQDRSFSPSGVISISGRKKNTLIYSGLVLLTFDANSDEEMDDIFKSITGMSTTYCCFRNHLGTGLNVLVKTDCRDGHHKTGYNQVLEAYQDYLNLKVSNPQQDEYILCQLSHDPNVYYNPDSRIFQVDINTKKQIVTDAQLYELYREEFEEQVKTTEQYVKLTEKTWNNYFGTLASNCSGAGIPITLTLEFIMRSFRLNSAVKGIVKRVYQKQAGKKNRPRDVVLSFHFKKLLNYNAETELDEILFFEYLVYNSFILGIPFYCAEKKVKAELKINRHRLNLIVGKFISMGFLDTYKKKVNEDDKFPTTHYRLILSLLPEAAQELMIDATYFLKSVMPLLAQKDNAPTGYFPANN